MVPKKLEKMQEEKAGQEDGEDIKWRDLEIERKDVEWELRQNTLGWENGKPGD